MSLPIRRRSFVWRAVLIMASLGAARGVFATAELRLIAQGDNPGQRAALRAIERRFGQVRISADPKAFGTHSAASVYVAVNAPALTAALAAELASPIVSLFSSSESFWSAIREAPRS